MSKESKLIGGLVGELNSSGLSKVLNSHTTKINNVVETLWPHHEDGRGLVLFNNEDARYTWTFDFNVETGVNPSVQGLDGTSIYSFSSNKLISGVPEYLTINPLFYVTNDTNPNISRPKTIYESLVALVEYIDDRIDSIDTTIEVSGSGCITDCNYTKTYIGNIAFDPTGSKNNGSIAFKVDQSLFNLNQFLLDIFGPTYSFASYTGGPPSGAEATRPLTIQEQLDALLELHNATSDNLTSIQPDDLDGPEDRIRYYWLPSTSAVRLIEDESYSSSSSVRLIKDLEENSYLLDATALNEWFTDSEINSPVFSDLGGHSIYRTSSVPRIWGPEGNYLVTYTRFNWSPNSVLLNRDTTGNTLADELRTVVTATGWSPDTQGLTLSCIYEVTGTPTEGDLAGNIIIGSDETSHLRNNVTITLHGLRDGTAYTDNVQRLQGIWKGTLEESGSLNPTILRYGVNKVLIKRKLQLADFEINSYDGYEIGDLSNDNLIKVDCIDISIMHRANNSLPDGVDYINLVGLEILIEDNVAKVPPAPPGSLLGIATVWGSIEEMTSYPTSDLRDGDLCTVTNLGYLDSYGTFKYSLDDEIWYLIYGVFATSEDMEDFTSNNDVLENAVLLLGTGEGELIS